MPTFFYIDSFSCIGTCNYKTSSSCEISTSPSRAPPWPSSSTVAWTTLFSNDASSDASPSSCVLFNTFTSPSSCPPSFSSSAQHVSSSCSSSPQHISPCSSSPSAFNPSSSVPSHLGSPSALSLSSPASQCSTPYLSPSSFFSSTQTFLNVHQAFCSAFVVCSLSTYRFTYS